MLFPLNDGTDEKGIYVLINVTSRHFKSFEVILILLLMMLGVAYLLNVLDFFTFYFGASLIYAVKMLTTEPLVTPLFEGAVVRMISISICCLFG